jgi:flagellin
MVIQCNMSAANANRQYGIVGKNRAKSTEKLSSGYRINRAADDAAGLAISEKMRRQIRGLKQGVNNTQDGVSLCQVADGALNELQDMMHRITELSVQAANGTYTTSER